MILGLTLLTLLIGTLLPVQAGLNAELTKILKHPFLGAFISFSMGAITLATIIVFQKTPVGDLKRLLSIPPYFYLGGVMGALFVGSSIYMFPRLGATTMMTAFVIGQLLSSVIIDHYGWFNLPTYHVTPMRIAGIILLFAGLFLVVRKPA